MQGTRVGSSPAPCCRLRGGRDRLVSSCPHQLERAPVNHQRRDGHVARRHGIGRIDHVQQDVPRSRAEAGLASRADHLTIASEQHAITCDPRHHRVARLGYPDVRESSNHRTPWVPRQHVVTLPELPAGKPRYLMGVGTPEDLIEAVRRGVDMFDCVMPTRNGRHGLAFTWAGRVNLRNAKHAEDLSPLDSRSTCPAARDYSRAYLHHLVRAGEYLGSMLLSWSNTVFYQQLMSAMRTAISNGRFDAWAEETLAGFERGEG